MHSKSIRWTLLLLAIAQVGSASGQDFAGPPFDDHVAPILARRCAGCHNGFDRKGQFDLTSKAAALVGGDSGAVLLPGDPAASLLWQRVAAGEMPPDQPLSEAERAVLKQWIAQGATWGTDPIDVFRFSTDRRAGRDWWSLQPLHSEPLPAASFPQLERSVIDRLVHAKLAEKGLRPSAEADRRTLIRRLAFDLLGLPPTPAEVESFVADPSEMAYEQLVRGMLESPQYGERWARHWLDVARYGESDGFEYDRLRPQAWHYRDWVIRALNEDLPYDQFARLQIAGDALQPTDADAVTATGFLVCGAHDGLIPQGQVMRLIMRQDALEDFVGTIGQTFLGLTVNCARCHDHKFDPIKQEEYYQLTAAVAGVTHGERTVQPAAPQGPALQQEKQRLEASIASIEGPVFARLRAEKDAPPGEANLEIAVSSDMPQPIHAWDFREGLQDQAGGLKITLHDGAAIIDGALQLDGQRAYAATETLRGEIGEKTLAARVRLTDLEQRGGGVISLQTTNGAVFDAIVFGEREPKAWMAGSNGFARTAPFAGEDETRADDEGVHVALVYQADGTIVGYRNGKRYGNAYASSGPVTFAAESAQLLFGLRHAPVGGNRMLAGAILTAALFDRALTDDQIEQIANDRPFVSREEMLEALDESQQSLHRRLVEQLAAVDQALARLQPYQVYAAVSNPPGKLQLLSRGNPLQPLRDVLPGGIEAVQGVAAPFGLAENATDAQRRIALADWVANAHNPLFARVIVNRIWHYHFGAGLVRTPNDFGFNGGEASHPQLLDWLAERLIADHWSLKELHYRIVTSATYRQQSRGHAEGMRRDAENRWLWRYPGRRLEAEVIRDTILQVAGQLNDTVGGPPYYDVRPYDHKGATFYEPLDPVGPEFQRRSVYRLWARGGRSPLLDVFDCPEPSATAPRRAVTTTPLQALTMLNNSFVIRMSQELACRIEQEAVTEHSAQVERLFQLAYGRVANPTEQQTAAAFVDRHGLAALCRVVLNSNEFLFVE